jgi:metal-sulfur cluster biosynthetic enzyme
VPILCDVEALNDLKLPKINFQMLTLELIYGVRVQLHIKIIFSTSGSA